MLPDKITIGKKYDTAMCMSNKEQADEYFELLVEHNMRMSEHSREKAEEIERTNLGYYAGYYDNETRQRVEKLFNCNHPIFGKATDDPVTPEKALKIGMDLGTRNKKGDKTMVAETTITNKNDVEIAQDSFTATELKKYNITDKQIADMSKHAMTLKVKDVNDKAGCKIVHDARIVVKHLIIGVEDTRTGLKAKSRKFDRDVDGEAKRIVALLLPIRDYLASQEKIVEDEKIRIKVEKARQAKERLEKEEAERMRIWEEEQDKIKAEQEKEAKRLEVIREEQEAKELQIWEEKQILDAEKREFEEKQEAAEKAIENERIRVWEEKEKKRLADEKEKEAEELRIKMLPDNELLEAFASTIEELKIPKVKYAGSITKLAKAGLFLNEACETLRDE
ncbi:hypothetical protein LCGC14_2198570 [marine sediment metagenome]|uniref:Uncharacterized protein n=1 Tax=marine sediment metagenome TaxID=412755 RepID=A0A0F9DHD5_9ZZZZ